MTDTHDERRVALLIEIAEKTKTALAGGTLKADDVPKLFNKYLNPGNPLASDGGNYQQGGGPYDQSGGGSHTQNGDGGYKQSKGFGIDGLINLNDKLNQLSNPGVGGGKL
jgi:hypothetical protein